MLFSFFVIHGFFCDYNDLNILKSEMGILATID